MTDKKRKIIVFGILFIAIIWGIWNNPFKSNKEDISSQFSDPDSSSLAAVKLTATKNNNLVFSDLAEWKDDPFVRSVSKKSKKPTLVEDTYLKLSVISKQGDSFMAIINGKIVKSGGQISGWKVLKVSKSAVSLTKGSRSRKLTLKG